MILTALALLAIVDTAPPTHAEAVRRWADMMAGERATADLCPGYVVDDEVLAAMKDRFGTADVDYFAFRPLAAAKADALKAALVEPVKRETWCRDEMQRGSGSSLSL